MQKPMWAPLVSGSAGALLDLIVGWQLVGPQQILQASHRFWIVLLHFAACGLLAPLFSGLLPSSSRPEKRLSLLLIFGFSSTLPVVGPLLVLAFTQLIRRLHPASDFEKNFYFGDNPYLTAPNEKAALDKTTHSIVEILNSANTENRRKAILAVRNLNLQAAIPILRHAQEDSDEQVRIFARSLLTRIMADLESSLKMVEGKTLQSEQAVERMIYVVERYHQFVELGLISERNRKIYLDKAILLLTEVHQRQPADEKILCLLLKYCISNGRIKDARKYLGKLREVNCGAADTVPWELEIAFIGRDWQAFQALLEKLKEDHSRDPKFRELYSFWSQRIGTI
jgi:hypothetical protein